MSQPSVESITLEVTYGPDGVPEHVTYLDQEGCGHESEPIIIGANIEALVQYHLEHLDRSHNIQPRMLCPKVIKLDDGGMTAHLRCTLTPHDEYVQHVFKI